MKLFYILLFFLPCSAAFVHRGNLIIVNDEPGMTADSVRDRTIIMNAFDVSAIKARKNKKELLYKLVDTLKYMIKAEMQRSSHRTVDITEQPFINSSQDDSSIYTLLRQNQAAYAIVIKQCDVYFEQRDVEVTKDADGTHRNASYDIYSIVKYAYYDSTHLLKESPVSVFHYFSTRSVMSGLFAAGPNIVSNKEAVFDIARENVSAYFRSQFPW